MLLASTSRTRPDRPKLAGRGRPTSTPTPPPAAPPQAGGGGAPPPPPHKSAPPLSGPPPPPQRPRRRDRPPPPPRPPGGPQPQRPAGLRIQQHEPEQVRGRAHAARPL